MKSLLRTDACIAYTLLFFTGILLSAVSFAQPSNDNCSAVQSITPTSGCTTPTTYNIKNATNASPTGSCGGATATTTYDMWFSFQATGTTHAVTLSNFGTNLAAASTYIQVLSGASCAGFTSLACQSASSRLVVNGLTIGTTYYLRIYVTTNPNGSGPASRYDFDLCLQGPPANDNCSGAISLTSNTTCSNTSGSLDLSSSTTGLPAGCEPVGTHYDVWYSFNAVGSDHTITLSGLGANISNPALQLYSGTCGSLTSIQCGTTSINATGLTGGSTYYVRVSHVGSDPIGAGAVSAFDICVTHPIPPPANDNCSGAINLTTNTSCSNTSGTLISATASSGIPAGCEGVGTHYDVWYSFVAARTYELIAISSLGANFTNPAIQLYSGSCGTLNSLACGTTSIAYSGLTIGNTYYVRVSNVGASISSAGTFNICVYHPNAATIDASKSYVNITKGTGGGTISPGDTLEIRGTLVIRNAGSTLDSVAYFDTLSIGSGVRLVPSSIALRTNEGKIYKSFTDAVDSDAGHFYVSGSDTVIRINMGLGASNVRRGRFTNTSRPSVFGSTCIVMATYRVVVYAAYADTINLGGGAFTMKDASTTIYTEQSFVNRKAVIYSSPGLCPGPVAATNAIGGDFNGTFGAPTTGAPFPRNRGTSVNVPSYIYKPFNSAGGPNDYYYGIANNTSSNYTTINTWTKPDSRRVFNVWDIIGDHTNATNTARGNNPCDTTQAVSATNPCGYMLVINSAYKTDTAFQYTVSNLCPNTYYEISAWFRNVCYKCGCDSTGTGASGATYIPFAPGDSSGVQPNIAFDINGTDYYTTGNIPYTGVTATQMGSDSTNQWVKRGFTYVTGTSQTSLTLTIRNNAPGGGGNDWALDDISLATCLPDMQYSPSLNPTLCYGNTITIYDTVRSYFNNYNHFIWQRSTDGGATWTDVTSPATATPYWNGTAWEYVTSYTVPPSNTTLADDGDLYRVIVATTESNLSSSSCQFTDGVSIIEVNVIDCGILLKTDFLSFTAKLAGNKGALSWITSKEDGPTEYRIEKSLDGINFTAIGSVNGYRNYIAETNYYAFTDSQLLNTNAWYRIQMKSGSYTKYSRILKLSQASLQFEVTNVVNPFTSQLDFEITTAVDTKMEVSLTDIYGRRLKQQTFITAAGVNSLSLPNTDGLLPGIYILSVKQGELNITRKVLKK